jgi:hypothetical protein
MTYYDLPDKVANYAARLGILQKEDRQVSCQKLNDRNVHP